MIRQQTEFTSNALISFAAATLGQKFNLGSITPEDNIFLKRAIAEFVSAQFYSSQFKATSLSNAPVLVTDLAEKLRAALNLGRDPKDTNSESMVADERKLQDNQAAYRRLLAAMEKGIVHIVVAHNNILRLFAKNSFSNNQRLPSVNTVITRITNVLSPFVVRNNEGVIDEKKTYEKVEDVTSGQIVESLFEEEQEVVQSSLTRYSPTPNDSHAKKPKKQKDHAQYEQKETQNSASIPVSDYVHCLSDVDMQYLIRQVISIQANLESVNKLYSLCEQNTQGLLRLIDSQKSKLPKNSIGYEGLQMVERSVLDGSLKKNLDQSLKTCNYSPRN